VNHIAKSLKLFSNSFQQLMLNGFGSIKEVGKVSFVASLLRLRDI
jgi:hypothetical protein